MPRPHKIHSKRASTPPTPLNYTPLVNARASSTALLKLYLMPHEPTLYEMAFLSLFPANWVDLFRGHSLCSIIFITINRHLILDLLFDSIFGSSGLCMIQLGKFNSTGPIFSGLIRFSNGQSL